jgi:hypothetical protein
MPVQIIVVDANLRRRDLVFMMGSLTAFSVRNRYRRSLRLPIVALLPGVLSRGWNVVGLAEIHDRVPGYLGVIVTAEYIRLPGLS